MNNVYASKADRDTHGILRVCVLHHYGGTHILIGNPSRKDLNKPNWYITDDLTPGAEFDPIGYE